LQRQHSGERWVDTEIKTPPQEMPRQGRGLFHPPPRQPLPHGAILHRYTASEEHPLTPFPARTSPKILSLPCARPSGSIATHCPPPLEGAGGGRGGGRAVGVDTEIKTPPQEMPRQGRGLFHPLPVSPSPTGRFSIDTLPVKSIPSPHSRREPHRRSCLSPVHGHRVNRHALPAPSGGGGRRPRRRPGGGGGPRG